MPRRPRRSPSRSPDGGDDPIPGSWSLGPAEEAVARRLHAWSAADVVGRIWRKEPSFWPQAPAAEVPDRLGWLRAPEQSAARLAELRGFGEELRREGVEHVVVLGMGGSSLAPEVIARVLPRPRGAPVLTVLDSTHPDAVRAVAERAPVERTVFLVSSKSGTTLEPNAFFRFFWERAGAGAGRRFVAITDPGTPLEKLAQQRGFRACFTAPPDVGGRYSALTVFGLVPSAVLGVDLDGLLGAARGMVARCTEASDLARNPGLRLGAALGELAKGGRDKLLFLTSPSLRAFPSWTEQLVAESLGKQGRGIVPVAQPPPTGELPTGPDVVLVHLALDKDRPGELEQSVDAAEAAGVPVLRFALSSPLDLGREFFRWEFAIAACGAVLEIDPFDQPDVEHAKELARAAMQRPTLAAGRSATYGLPPTAAGAPAVDGWLGSVHARDYVAVQAFLAPGAATDAGLARIASALRRRLGVVVTTGYGPRFLHSTGQLHKGGPPTGAFLQIVDEPPSDLAVPELGLGFRAIIRAQAVGDRGALEEKRRRVLVINVGARSADGLAALASLLDGTSPTAAGVG